MSFSTATSVFVNYPIELLVGPRELAHSCEYFLGLTAFSTSSQHTLRVCRLDEGRLIFFENARIATH